MDGHRNVTTPAAMPVTPRKATQPRWTSIRSAIAADSAVMPSTKANAPHSTTSAHSVMDGHTSVASPNSTAATPWTASRFQLPTKGRITTSLPQARRA